jgi:hypothetical protein
LRTVVPLFNPGLDIDLGYKTLTNLELL